jgi:hypothetical protein
MRTPSCKADTAQRSLLLIGCARALDLLFELNLSPRRLRVAVRLGRATE